MTDRDMQTWSLDFGHVPELFAVVLLLACVAFAVAEGVAVFRRSGTGAGRRMQLAILGLRFVAILGLLGVAFELTLRIEQVAPAGRRVVVLADSTKLGRDTTVSFAELGEVDVLITDAPPGTIPAEIFAKHGVEVVIA